MNIYTDAAFYSEIMQDDAVYNHTQWISKKAKNARRTQRKQKQAARNARYDSF